MILFSVSYFIYLLRQLPEDDLLKFPMFWINSAIVVFFSGVFVLSYFRDYIVLVLEDDTAGFWAFRNFFSTAYWLVLAYAGWLSKGVLWTTCNPFERKNPVYPIRRSCVRFVYLLLWNNRHFPISPFFSYSPRQACSSWREASYFLCSFIKNACSKPACGSNIWRWCISKK